MTKAYLEPDEVDELERRATCLRDQLLIRMLFHLACRISEVLAVGVDDVDFDQGTVRILHLKSRVRLSCPSCGARLSRSSIFCSQCGSRVEEAVADQTESRRMRNVPLDRKTLEMIRFYIKHGGPVSRNGKQLLFGINRHHAWEVVSRCAHDAGLGALVNPETGKTRGISPHRLRDSFAVMAVRRDGSTDGVRMLQEQLGHASIGTTMRYRKVAGQELEEWYQKLWGDE